MARIETLSSVVAFAFLVVALRFLVVAFAFLVVAFAFLVVIPEGDLLFMTIAQHH
jgi:hypothetical protein